MMHKSNGIVEKKRIDWDNIYYIMNDRNGCTDKDIEEYNQLPYKNKVLFTHLPKKKMESCFYIKGFEKDKSVGTITAFETCHPFRRRMDRFDWVKWINKKEEE